MSSWCKGPAGPPPTAPLPPIPDRYVESSWEDSPDEDEPERPQTAIHTPTQSFENVMKVNLRISQENLLRSISVDPTPNEMSMLKGFLSEMFHAYLELKVPAGAVGSKMKRVADMRGLFDERLSQEPLGELYNRYRKANPAEQVSFRASNGLPRSIFRELMREWAHRVVEGAEKEGTGNLGNVRFTYFVGSFLERFMKDWKPKLVLPGKSKKKTAGNVTPKASSSPSQQG